jgi:hypothetical protein
MNRYCSSFLLLTIAFLLPAVSLQAQKPGTVRGNVFDKETTQPVAFATVQIEGTTLGGTTDINGFFTVGNVPPGEQTLIVSYLGYDAFTTKVTIRSGDIAYQNIYLQESGTNLGEVVISGQQAQARTEVQVSKLTVTPREIRALPSAGGQADIAQYLTVLPGVIFTGDQGGQLYIRGGSPVQNRIILDGMTIYNPFHSIGFFSVFETELIRNVDVFTGGFNADYGGRISAVVDVNTREGNRRRIAGQVSASPFQAKALIEGPIVPLKPESSSGNTASFVLTGKKALINRFDKTFYPHVNDSVGIPFDYQDIYGKLSLQASNGSRFNAFGFNYTDGVKFPITEVGWKSSGGGIDFTLVPSNSNTIVAGTFTYSGYDSRIEEADRQPRSSSIGGFQAGMNFTNFDLDNEVKYGFDLTSFRTEFEFINFRQLTINQFENTTEIAAYVRYKRKFGPLVIEPGFRIQYYVSFGQISPEPRLGLKYNITDRLRFKAAGGLYSQNLLATVNERDIVNLFVGFLTGGQESIYKPGTTEPTSSRLQKAAHAVAGFEFDIAPNFNINIEAYYKDFSQLLALNRNKLLATDPNFVVETGDARGIDFSLKYEARRYYIWGAYSLGYVTRNDGQQIYPPVFDRRHNLNLVGTYQFGRKEEWEFGARWNFGSGFPFTLTQGFYTNYTFNDGIGTDVLTGNGDNVGIIYADERNTGRLPYYHRLDLSLKRLFSFSRYTKLEVTASATNVYDRDNIFYFDRVRFARVNQLPLLPSLSLTLQF